MTGGDRVNSVKKSCWSAILCIKTYKYLINNKLIQFENEYKTGF